MALALHRLEPRYAWRSILTVAVEDIGIGSPEAVLWATAAQRAGFRKAVGEIPLLIGLTRRMATGLKSRSAVELAFIVETGEPEMFRAFGSMTTGQLLDRFDGADLYEAYAAVAVLRGIVPSGYQHQRPDQHGVMAVCEMLPSQMDVAAVRAAQTALLHPLDNMSLGFVVAARLNRSELERRDPFPDSLMIAGYPAETYDQHERLGRRAVGLFARSLLSASPDLARLPCGKAKAAVADAVFVEEGQCLDRWLAGRDLDRLRVEADYFSLGRHGLSAEQATAVRYLVRERLTDLHRLRSAVVRDASFNAAS